MTEWLGAHTLWGHSLAVWLGWAWGVSAVVLTAWIVLQRRAPVSTLAWIMLLNLMPVIGLVIYAYFGPQRVKRQRSRRWAMQAQACLLYTSDAADE